MLYWPRNQRRLQQLFQFYQLIQHKSPEASAYSLEVFHLNGTPRLLELLSGISFSWINCVELHLEAGLIRR